MLSAILIVSAEMHQLSKAWPSVLLNNKPIPSLKLWSQKSNGSEHKERRTVVEDLALWRFDELLWILQVFRCFKVERHSRL